MQKIRYEIDPHNRLVLDERGRKSDLAKFRKVLDGRFKTDANNNLSYHLKAPINESENIPHQIRIKGAWALTDNHELRLTLDKQGRETFGDQITLKGEILDVNKNSLLFAVTTATKEGRESTYVLNLAGAWKADENNRLSFHVRKENNRYDILTFNGAWEINKNHQIVYQYEKARLIRKKTQTHTLIFRGHWDIKDGLRISYVLSEDSDSVFSFNTKAGIFNKDYIQYEVGIGLSGKGRTTKRTITLSGKWNFDRNTRLTFTIGNGARLELTRKIFDGDGAAFLRALMSGKESAVYAGAGWRW